MQYNNEYKKSINKYNEFFQSDYFYLNIMNSNYFDSEKYAHCFNDSWSIKEAKKAVILKKDSTSAI